MQILWRGAKGQAQLLLSPLHRSPIFQVGYYTPESDEASSGSLACLRLCMYPLSSPFTTKGRDSWIVKRGLADN
jgi:hypothetical protein